MLIAEIQHAPGVGHHAGRPGVPSAAIDTAGEGLYLKIVLNIDRKNEAGIRHAGMGEDPV
jgi:hypothetical protein